MDSQLSNFIFNYMNDISKYIMEKLHLNDKIEVNKNEYIPEEKEYEAVKTIFNNPGRDNGQYKESTAKGILNLCRGDKSLLKHYIALLNITKSTPYKYGDEIRSYPGNYGFEFTEKLIKKGYFKIDEILSNCEPNIDDNIDLIDSIKKYYLSKVESLCSMLSKNLTYELIDEYSDAAKKKFNELVSANYKPIIVSFIVEYKGKKAKCETIYAGTSYFFYSVDGTVGRWSDDFLQELLKKLDIK